MPMHNCFAKRRNMALAGWTKRLNHCDGRSELNICRAGKEMTLPFIQCRYEAGYEHLVVSCCHGCVSTPKNSLVSPS